MKVIGPQDISNVSSWEQLRNFSSRSFQAILEAVNGQISFTENVDCSYQTVQFTAANTSVAVKHNLGRVAANYIVAGKSAEITVFDSGTSNEENVLYVQASGAGTVRLLIF